MGLRGAILGGLVGAIIGGLLGETDLNDSDNSDNDLNTDWWLRDWYCSGCGTYMNYQSGFMEWSWEWSYNCFDREWSCTECDHVNKYDSEGNNIYC